MSKNGHVGPLTLEIEKKGITLEEASTLFPEILSKRGKYLLAAQSILEQSRSLNESLIHPCEMKNGDPAKALGLVHFTNDFLKENQSNWRLKFSPVSGKYALYNLALLGKKTKAKN